MTTKFSDLYLTSTLCTRIPDRANKLKTFVLLIEATIFRFFIFVEPIFFPRAGIRQKNIYKKSNEN